MTSLLPCIRCGEELESALPAGRVGNQPHRGTVFTSHGHYGSTVFDPMDGSYLELTVCDECLRKLRDKRVITHVRAQRPVVCRGVNIGTYYQQETERAPWGELDARNNYYIEREDLDDLDENIELFYPLTETQGLLGLMPPREDTPDEDDDP